jgi:hypothetical protein
VVVIVVVVAVVVDVWERVLRRRAPGSGWRVSLAGEAGARGP